MARRVFPTKRDLQQTRLNQHNWRGKRQITHKELWNHCLVNDVCGETVKLQQKSSVMSGNRRLGMTAQGVPKLLSRVGGQPHATQEHHEDLIPERYTGGPRVEKERELEDEDVNRDPASDSDSSDDDKENSHADPLAPPRKTASHRIRAPRANIHATGTGVNSSKPRSREKATSKNADPEEDLGDGFVMSSSSQGKRKTTHTTYSKRGRKKMALEKGTEAAKAPEAPKAAGRAYIWLAVIAMLTMSQAGFKHPTAIDKLAAPKIQFKTFAGLAKPSIAGSEEHSVPQSSQTSSIQFRRPDLETLPSTDTSTAFRPARTTTAIASSPLTELSSSDDDDAKYTRPKTVDQGKAEKSCPLCGEEVDVVFKRDFLIEKCKGKRMNVRLQELFCKAHKERTAKKQWQDREYPEIDWIALPRRLKRHGRRRIQDVLDGKVHSVYRDELEGRLRSGKTKSAMQVWVNETDTLVRVGYYGSRGEKAMYVAGYLKGKGTPD